MIIKQVYTQILSSHLNSFGEEFSEITNKIIQGTISIYKSIARDSQFNPSAKKFHY